MTMDQMMLFGSQVSELKKDQFKETVVAMSWAVAGVPESQQHLFE